MAYQGQWTPAPAPYAAPAFAPSYNPVPVAPPAYGYQPTYPPTTTTAPGAWFPAPQPVQANAYSTAHASAIVLYNQFPSTMPGASFGKPPPPKPQVNPFTPGLAPLPPVPSPKTFVTEDPRMAAFPCSTKTAHDDPFNWITPQIFATFADKASSTATAKATPLRQMTATR